MGADIHLLNEEGKVVSYFRDAYHSTSLFALLGLSWWTNVLPLCENGYLSMDNAKKFKDLLLENPVTMEHIVQLSTKRDCTLEDRVEMLARYEQEWKKLLHLIEQSIESKLPLLCFL